MKANSLLQANTQKIGARSKLTTSVKHSSSPDSLEIGEGTLRVPELIGGSSHSGQSSSSHSVVMKPISDDRQPVNRQPVNRQRVNRQPVQQATGAFERSFPRELPMLVFTRGGQMNTDAINASAFFASYA